MNRKILFSIILVLLFAIGIIVWFFVFSKPNSSPSLGGPSNPFGNTNLPKLFQFVNNNEDDTPVSTSVTEMTFATPQALTEIWSKPATGQTFVDIGIVKEVEATSTKGTTTVMTKKLVNATSTILMFVDRTTGHVYAYNREISKLYQISNTTVPGIYDAYIFNNGKQIVLRYADNEKKTIVGVLANIPSVKETEQARPLENVKNLPSQVSSVAVNKNGSLLSYLVTGDNGGAIYTISPNKDAVLVANTPLKEWSLTYGGNNLYATSKPSAYLKGQTVLIPTFEFIVGDKTGLMSTPGDAGYIINSMWSSNGLKTFISSPNQQSVLDISTLASKCSWGKNNFVVCAVPKNLPESEEGLPDDWFQGRVSFDDTLVFVNSNTNDVSTLYSFESNQDISFDITKISLSSDNLFIVFNRKQNSSLWFLDTNLINQ